VQKRLVRKLDLEMLLSEVNSHPSPNVDLEQYTISTSAAAEMLYIAAYVHDDIVGRTVLDLGCGTGRLALGAAFLGAKHVVGVDIDENAIQVAVQNSVKTGLKGKVNWVVADISTIHGDFDTVVQNPPFGVQKKTADRKFLEKALETGKVVYSLHKHPTNDSLLAQKIRSDGSGFKLISPSPFLKRFAEEHGSKIRSCYALLMSIPHMFSFHTKRRHDFVVDLYVIERQAKTS
jgi:putative methylase